MRSKEKAIAVDIKLSKEAWGLCRTEHGFETRAEGMYGISILSESCTDPPRSTTKQASFAPFDRYQKKLMVIPFESSIEATSSQHMEMMPTSLLE